MRSKYCPDTLRMTGDLMCEMCSEQHCKYFFCLVVGSRGFEDYPKLKEELDLLLKDKDEVAIVSGGAKGADALAKYYAKENNLKYYEFKADWSKGKSAGFERNEEMHQFISHFERRMCVAFWDGKSHGTAHSFDLAKKYNNELKVVKYS